MFFLLLLFYLKKIIKYQCSILILQVQDCKFSLFCYRIEFTPLVAAKFYAKRKEKEMKEQKEKITEKEWYRRKIVEMVDGIDRVKVLKYLYIIIRDVYEEVNKR